MCLIYRRNASVHDLLLWQDVFNFEVFMAHLTQEERQKLMKYLPSVDTAKPPERHVCASYDLYILLSFWRMTRIFLNCAALRRCFLVHNSSKTSLTTNSYFVKEFSISLCWE